MVTSGPASAESGLIEAVKQGDVPAVTALCERESGVLAGEVDEHAKTPLHWAAELDRAEIAGVLVAAGADLAAETTWGMTPLQWAGVVGSRGVAEVLLAHGARLDLPTAAGLGLLSEVEGFEGVGDPGESGESGEAVSAAFVLACRNGHREVAELLHRRGADVDFPGALGGRAVHWAAIHGHDDVVAFLVEAGADLDHRDDTFDATPAGWATEGGHHALAARLTRP